jgi:hypothetical protein
LAFESEICRLHSDGHGYEAIREALSDAGVNVSLSTVKREVARGAKRKQAHATTVANLFVEQPASRTVVRDAGPVLVGDQRSGKEIAEAFVKGRIANPLLRTRSAA